MTLVVDNGKVAERPVGHVVMLDGEPHFFAGSIPADDFAHKNGVSSDRLYTGALVNYLQGLIVELRDGRVKLQGENESLRHDLAEAHRELSDMIGDEFARRYEAMYKGEPVLRPTGSASLDEMAEALHPVKTEADIAALAERLARVEDTIPGIRSDVKALHRRIDAVVETIGDRIGDLDGAVSRAHQRVGRLQVHTGADDANDLSLEDRNGFRSMLTRIGDLENLAKQRGARLDDLERRQHQDDLDHERASGDGMPEAPERDDETVTLVGGEGQTFEVPRSVTTLHDVDRTAEKRETYTVGDEVRLDGAPTAGGHHVSGWFRVAGIGGGEVPEPYTVQVRNENPRSLNKPLYWIAPVSVLEARHVR